MPVPQILVIAEETPMRATLSAVLAEAGYTLTAVENGSKGVNALRDGDYDVVLCDVRFLRHDAFALLEVVNLNNSQTIFDRLGSVFCDPGLPL